MNKVLGFICIVLLALGFGQAMAQDNSTNEITVCRDPRFAWVRLEFHNLPADWLVWGGTSWSYYAEGVAQYGDVLVADALEKDTDGYLTGTATIYEGDGSSYKLEGNADSVLCDPSLSPVQDDGLEIILTPTPTAVPTEEPVQTACAAIAMNAGTKAYCYTPRPDGLVPIPPEPT